MRSPLLVGSVLALGALLAPMATVAPAEAALPSPARSQLVSVARGASDTLPGDRGATSPSVSADGRYVAFSSKASNLTDVPTAGISQVYLRDVIDGKTTMISASAGVAGTDNSIDPAVSADGRYVAFSTRAANLGVAFPGGVQQVLVWDRLTGYFQLASSADGSAAAANTASGKATISGDGTVVAFESGASNLTTTPSRGVTQVYVHDLIARTTRTVSVDSATPSSSATDSATLPSISADGRRVTFVTASALTSVSGSRDQVYLRDLDSSTTSLVSADAAGTAGANEHVASARISADGRTVAFDTSASNLTGETLTGGPHVFTRDLAKAVTTLVSRSQSGAIVKGSRPSVSANGSAITFSSLENGVTAATNSGGTEQSYLRNMVTNDVMLLSKPWASGGAARPGNILPVSSVVSGDGRFAVFVSTSTNLIEGSVSTDDQVFIRNIADTPDVIRVAGADRFEVTAAVSKRLFSEDTFSLVYVASGETYPDALAASAAAAAVRSVGAPVLLVRKDELPADVATELRRYRPRSVVVIGGSAVISDKVVTEIESVTGRPAIRVGGADRFATAAATSAFMFHDGAKVAYIASGQNFPDSLVAGALAGRSAGPILLTTRDDIPTAVTDELKRLRPEKIVVLGGINAISDSVAGALMTIAPVSRIGGSDRFVVAANASAANFDASTRTVYVASGENFPDALSSAAAAAAESGPVLLIRRDGIPGEIASELRRLNPRKIIIVGGPAAVTESVASQLRGFLRRE